VDRLPNRAQTAQALRQQIVGIDQMTPLLDGTKRPYIYLDNAASTPAFRRVQDKVDEFLVWYSSVHRGTGFKSLVATHAYEQAREIVARFVGADPKVHAVIFGKNTTEAINKLANRIEFQPGDVVVTTAMEHHSNDLPWRPKAQVEYVGLGSDGALDLEAFRRTLKHLCGRVKLVAVTGASNVSGFVPPIHDMAELAHEHGALIVVDCAQLAPHRAIDMGPLGGPRSLDFVTLSAHKMYAPFGSGALIGPLEFFAKGAPDYRGGGTIDIVTLDEVHWADPPERDEAGSPNVVGAVALASSIRVLTEVGMDAVAAHEMDLTRYALLALNQLDGIKIYGSCDPERLEDRLGVIAFAVKGMPHGKVAAILGFEGGIGVRNGCFCAHPYLLRLLGVSDAAFHAYRDRVLQHDRSGLPGLVRASFGCYNTQEEIDALVEVLQRILHGDIRGEYVIDRASGQYAPRSYDPITLGEYFAI
jgi:selenocysteine lyase/cysteine desulfurase